MVGAMIEEGRQRWETNRVEAFSDGVFAIAITLLVLEISISPSDFGDLRHALLAEWPSYLAYITSFLTVGSVWIAHHALFVRLRYVDPVLLRLNLVLLMVAAFLPFPTGVLAEALDASRESERVAVAFYGATALVIDLLLQASIRYAASQPELWIGAREDVPTGLRERGWRTWVSSVAYGVAILAGIFVFPKLAAAGYLAVAVRGVVVVGGEGRLGLGGLSAAGGDATRALGDRRKP
jgi:TMEM175 potassium channel family protein